VKSYWKIFLTISISIVIIGSFWFGLSARFVKSMRNAMLTLGMGSIILAFVLFGILVYLTYRFIAKPVKAVIEGTKKVREGDLNYRIKIMTTDELGELINSFNKMTEDLQKAPILKERKDDIIEGLADSLIIFNNDGDIEKVNKTTCELLKSDEGKLIGNSIENIIISKEGEPMNAFKLHSLISRNALKNYEVFYLRKDGKKIPILLNCREMEDDDKIGKSILCMGINIAKWKEAEAELRESEEKYRMLFDSANDAILLIKDGQVIDCNHRALDMFECTKLQIIGHSAHELSTPTQPNGRSSSEVVISNIDAVKEGEPQFFEWKCLKFDGTPFDTEVSLNLIELNGDDCVQAIIRDVTERKEMERELLKRQKLESLGILAGGIAHDFNNLLTGIMGSISVAKTKVDPDDILFHVLNQAERASRKAEKLTQQLLTFSKGGAPIKETASITEIIKESAEFALRGSNVKCKFDFPDELWMVEVDKDQMSQVINNLIINADKAMPEGGIINVSASNFDISEDNILPIIPGNYVRISIVDNGVGIPEEHLPKVFDPYFTTRDSGSGLGLTTVYSIIKRHNGYITVESEEGVGSVFYIYLPAVLKKEDIKEKEDKKESPDIYAKILLMDDEEVIRDVAGRILERLGYKVELAQSGEEMIEKYRDAYEKGDGYDAVLMDLTIPGGMGGKEAIEELLKIDSNVKAIVSSGYFNDPIMAHYKEHGFSGVVPKPYETEELEEVIKKVLEK
jgi:two-component system cell cycle sensor histidine kinase/response regulator CckA